MNSRDSIVAADWLIVAPGGRLVYSPEYRIESDESYTSRKFATPGLALKEVARVAA
jgi:hypothetical protein